MQAELETVRCEAEETQSGLSVSRAERSDCGAAAGGGGACRTECQRGRARLRLGWIPESLQTELVAAQSARSDPQSQLEAAQADRTAAGERAQTESAAAGAAAEQAAAERADLQSHLESAQLELRSQCAAAAEGSDRPVQMPADLQSARAELQSAPSEVQAAQTEMAKLKEAADSEH